MIPPASVAVPFSVVVIGGGFAGLSAVQTLVRESSLQQEQQTHHDQTIGGPRMHITLLEAKDGLGGRMQTVSLNAAPTSTTTTTTDTADDDSATRTNTVAVAPVVADMGGMYFHGQGSVLASLQEAFPDWKTTGSGGDSAVPAGQDAIFKVYHNNNNDHNHHGAAAVAAASGIIHTPARDLTPCEQQEISNLFTEWMKDMQTRIHEYKNSNNDDNGNDAVDESSSSSTHPALLSKWSKEFCARVILQRRQKDDPDSTKEEEEEEKDKDDQQHRDRMSLLLQKAGLEFYQRMHFDLDFAISYPNVAMHGFTNDWDCCDLPGDDVVSVDGMRALIDAMELQLTTTTSSSTSSSNDNDENNHTTPTTLTIRKQTRVERIEYDLDCSQTPSSTSSTIRSNKACRIITSDQSVFEADACICTIPLGVLKQRATMQGGGLFVPPLPSDKLQALERAGVGTLNTLVVQWNKPIHCYCEKTAQESKKAEKNRESTTSSLPSAYYLIGPADKNNDNNHVVDKNTNPLWHGFVFPGVLRNQDDTSITQFHFFETENLPFDNLDFWKVQALQVVQAAVAGSSGDNKNPLVLGLDDIVNVQLSAWHLDPDCLGSYSAPTTKTRGNVDRKILAEPMRLPGSSGSGLYFAGEHTHYEGRFATMDGAYETGIRAARQVLQQRADSAGR